VCRRHAELPAACNTMLHPQHRPKCLCLHIPFQRPSHIGAKSWQAARGFFIGKKSRCGLGDGGASGWPAKLSGHMIARTRGAAATGPLSLCCWVTENTAISATAAFVTIISHQRHALLINLHPRGHQHPEPPISPLILCPPPAHLGSIGWPFPRRCDKVTPPRRLC
jgi:hypothetical protein